MKKKSRLVLFSIVCSLFIFFTSAIGFAGVCEDYEEVSEFLDTLVEDGKTTSWSEFTSPSIPEDHCAFSIDFIQPVDHKNPEGPTFIQTIVLDHGAKDAPTVFRTNGYYMRFSRREPSRILNANQLSAGHRYYGDIDASMYGYDYLNEFQAASDHNAILLAIAPFYEGAFLVTGVSKGGETAAFFQYYYPETHREYIDGTISYVAPISRGRADNRYRKYIDRQLEVVGCSQKMLDFQREVMKRSKNEDFLALMDNYGVFNVWPGGKRGVLDSAVSEYSFYVLQYTGHCDNVPLPNVTDEEILESLEEHAGISWYSDYGWSAYTPYFWQAWTHQGYGALHTQPIIDRLVYNPNNYAPYIMGVEGMDPEVGFDASVLADIERWAKRESRKIMFLYGSIDPYTAAAYSVGHTGIFRDAHKFTVQGGTHRTQLCDLPDRQRRRVMRILKRWTGVEPQCESQAAAAFQAMPEVEELNIRKIKIK